LKAGPIGPAFCCLRWPLLLLGGAACSPVAAARSSAMLPALRWPLPARRRCRHQLWTQGRRCRRRYSRPYLLTPDGVPDFGDSSPSTDSCWA